MLRYDLRVWLIKAVIAVLLLYGCIRVFLVAPALWSSITGAVLYPCMVMQKAVQDRIGSYRFHQSNLSSLQKQVHDLTQENETLKQDIFELHMKTIVFEEMDEIIDFAKRYEVADKKLVKVLMRMSNSVQQSLWIEGGAHDGIVQDMVVVYKDHIVGRVSEVYSWYSKVMLLSDKQSKIAGVCMQNKEVVGVAFGKNEALLDFQFVPHFAQVSIDDLVVSSGQGMIFPSGFIIGKITNAQVDGVSYHIQIQPLMDYKQLDYVYVIQQNITTLDSQELT